MSDHLTVAIVGGGIGGLSAAIAFRQAGHEATVYEQAPKIEPLGTSLSLWPNAMACLADWGLAGDIAAKGANIPAIAARRMGGEPYFCADLGDICTEFGQPAICVRRADLQSTLLGKLGAEHVKLSHKVETVRNGPDAAVLEFCDGDSVAADLIVAADGINSGIRHQVLGDGPARYAGYGAWLGIAEGVPNPKAHDEIAEYYGPNGRFGLCATGSDKSYWFFVVNSATAQKSADTSPLLKDLEDWPEFTQQLVEATPRESLVYVPFLDRPPSKVWGKGRILLLGDAIHPFTPNLGQGACQAIEDAHVLGQIAAMNPTAKAILPAYQRTRAKRAAMFARQSRQIGTVAQMTHPALRWLRELLLRTASARQWQRTLRKHFTRPPVISDV